MNGIPVQRDSNDSVIEMTPITPRSSSDISDLSDIDRGMKLLSDALFAHSGQNYDYVQLVIDLRTAKQKNEELEKAYKASKERWRIWKWVGGALSFAIVSFTVFVDLYDRMSSSREVSKNQTLKILTPISTASTLASTVFTLFAYICEGRRKKQLKKLRDLTQKDKDFLKKLEMVLENWGKLHRAREIQKSGVISHETINTHESARKCFKHIDSLPLDERIPPKAHLASMTLMLLDDEHPAKQAVNKIKELSEASLQKDESDPNSHGFQDIGQKGTLDGSYIHPPSPRENEEKLLKRWRRLTEKMNGLNVSEIIHDGVLFTRPVPMSHLQHADHA